MLISTYINLLRPPLMLTKDQYYSKRRTDRLSIVSLVESVG